ncbi:MAG: hypothetical protein K1X57_18970 [Gemmataceae bacterium]|nr:hypothetical protein [Gemmataceae bacterium]
MSATTATDDRLLAESWAGEIRVNLLRAVALGAMYLWHLIRFYSGREVGFSPRYHMAVTALTIAGMVLVVVWHLILAAQVRPPILPIATTLGDLVIVTALFALSRNALGTQSHLAYFLVVAGTAVRCSLPAVWVASLGSVVCYYSVILYWTQSSKVIADQPFGPWLYGMFTPAILVAGLLAGQCVRQTYRIAGSEPA